MKTRFTKGFTVMETMLALGIFLMLYFVIVKFQVNTVTNATYSFNSIQSATDARAILRTMVSELRTMQPSSNGAYPIAAAATSSITFFSDIDGDGLKDQVRYFIATTTLKKGVIKPTGSPPTYNSNSEKLTILARDIKNGTSTALFQYYDDSYTGTTSPMSLPILISGVRLVKINLLIDADPNRSPLPRLYTSQVSLRNLKDNL